MSEVNETESRVTDTPETYPEEREDSRSGEMLKFGILAVIMLGSILVVALLRPVIFGRIVPAVLGEGLPPEQIDEEEEHDVYLPVNQTDSEATATPQESEGEAVPEVTVEAQPAEEEATEEATAVPPQTHTVQPGETLTAIAEKYEVTVQVLIDANQIGTPNRIRPGTELIIPDSAE